MWLQLHDYCPLENGALGEESIGHTCMMDHDEMLMEQPAIYSRSNGVLKRCGSRFFMWLHLHIATY
jgi:hypothetical protein